MTVHLGDLVRVSPVHKSRSKPNLKPSASLPLETSFGYLAREIHRMQARLLQDELSAHGVSGGCWYFLRVLWIEDALTQKELSVRTGVNEATARIAVDRMEKEKLVVREQDHHDRRKWIVRLTTRGNNLESELIAIAVNINMQAMSGFSDSGQAALIGQLRKIHGNLKRMQPRPPGRVRALSAKRPLRSPATDLLGSASD